MVIILLDMHLFPTSIRLFQSTFLWFNQAYLLIKVIIQCVKLLDCLFTLLLVWSKHLLNSPRASSIKLLLPNCILLHIANTFVWQIKTAWLVWIILKNARARSIMHFSKMILQIFETDEFFLALTTFVYFKRSIKWAFNHVLIRLNYLLLRF